MSFLNIYTSLKDIFNAKNIQGVIIDLRGNHGGDMRPMLGAISPFLHDGKVLSFVSKQKQTSVI
ncbi:S41 family peptidase (plasmid) [Vagococcus lutrae]|uniref:S41 family peptidase n=1 Tax=Vagococcus lutrae TaxID=81947 RepID=UPI00232C573D|nr:S41 family peptidase [Vagococcus lutrae]WCG06126.1 S41 family peptidase [Vagococcus lutrae]